MGALTSTVKVTTDGAVAIVVLGIWENPHPATSDISMRCKRCCQKKPGKNERKLEAQVAVPVAEQYERDGHQDC